MKSRFGVLPILLAMVMAVASMPTEIYQICAWNVGTVKAEPWRAKVTASVAATVRSITSRLRAWAEGYDAWPTVAAASGLVALALITGQHESVLVGAAVMGKLKEFRQRASDLTAEVAKAKRDRAAIGEAVIARPADKRTMTDDERASFAALGTKIDGLDSQIAENAEFLRIAEEANEAERRAATPAPTADAAASAAAAAAAQVARVDVGQDNTTKAPGYFGRQLHAVRKAALIAKGIDETLTTDDQQLLKPMRAAATGATTDIPSDGGFLVGQQRTSTVLQRIYETGQILSRVNRMPIGAGFNGAKLPAIDETSRANGSRYGGIVSGWLGQGNTMANVAGRPKFREIDLKLRKVGALVYSTDEMNVDSVLFEAWVNKYLPLELQFRAEDAVVNGTGAPEMQGLLNSDALISVTRNTTGAVVSEDLRAMYYRLWAPLRSSAVFLISQEVEADIEIAYIALGTAGQLDPSYRPAGDGRPFATYKNIPLIPVEYCAAKGTAGDIVLVCLPEYALIDKGGVDQAVSLHVAFLTDEAVYRFIYRVDGQLSWNSALTPKNSGSTLSCALALTT